MPATATEALQNVHVTSPAGLLAIVPHLLGFTPDNSLVVIGIKDPCGQVEVTLRYDLPGQPGAQFASGIAEHAMDILNGNEIHDAIVIGYGRKQQVTPLADAIRRAAAPAGISVRDILRFHEGRYWSYLCQATRCCPAEGIPFDHASHPAATALAAASGTVVAVSRDGLAETIAAVSGEDAESMRRATRAAENRADLLVGSASRARKPGAVTEAIAAAGRDAVEDAVRTYRGGRRIGSDDQIAWLTLLLRDVRVRDNAWARMDPDCRRAHQRLWTDITRRARPGYIAAPATLLAFVAWQSGNGTLANVALDRALADQPGYSLAGLLRSLISNGLPPSCAQVPMTPQQVEDAYRVRDAAEHPDDARNNALAGS